MSMVMCLSENVSLVQDLRRSIFMTLDLICLCVCNNYIYLIVKPFLFRIFSRLFVLLERKYSLLQRPVLLRPANKSYA